MKEEIKDFFWIVAIVTASLIIIVLSGMYGYFIAFLINWNNVVGGVIAGITGIFILSFIIYKASK